MRHSYAAAPSNLRHWLEGCVEDSLGKNYSLLTPTYVVSARTHTQYTRTQADILIASGVWTVADNVTVITIFLLNKYSQACARSRVYM